MAEHTSTPGGAASFDSSRSAGKPGLFRAGRYTRLLLWTALAVVASRGPVRAQATVTPEVNAAASAGHESPSATVGGQDTEAEVSPLCFPLRRYPACRTGLVVGVEAGWTVAGGDFAGEDPLGVWAWEIGADVNLGTESTLGGAVHFGGEGSTDYDRQAVEVRYRRWLSDHVTALFSAGPVRLQEGSPMGRGSLDYRWSHGITIGTGIIHREWFGAQARLDVLVDPRGESSTAATLGGRLDSWPAVVATATGT